MIFLASNVTSAAFCSDQLGTRRDLCLTLKTEPENVHVALVYRVVYLYATHQATPFSTLES